MRLKAQTILLTYLILCLHLRICSALNLFGKPIALSSATMHSKTPSSHNSRKARTEPHMHKSVVRGGKLRHSSMHALYPSVSKDIDISVGANDWLLFSKRKSPQSAFEGTKLLHAKSTEKIDSESDAFRMEKTCHNVALNGNALKDNSVLHDNREHSMHAISDASREGLGKEHGDINTKENDTEEAVLQAEPTHFWTWFAGLSIRALLSQLRFICNLCTALLLAWYHSFLFAWNPRGYMLKAKVRAIKAHRKETNEMVILGPKIKERVSSIQSTIVKGARRLAFGCSAAFYTIMILTLLFVASMILGHIVVKGFVPDQIQLYEDLHFDYTKPLPIASVDFVFSKVHSDAGRMMRSIAHPTRKFRATVFFTLPESDSNKELGIFQVTTEVLSVTGQVLLSRTQPCMLRFRSTALQHAKSLLMAIPLLMGFSSETQTLAMSVEWHECGSVSFAGVNVMLAPRAGRLSVMGLPELYAAKIHIKSELPWWVAIIGHWRWTLSVWIGLGLFSATFVLLLFLCKQLLIPDLRCIFSFVTDGLVHGKYFVGKTKCLKHEKIVHVSALKDVILGGKHAEIHNTCVYL